MAGTTRAEISTGLSLDSYRADPGGAQQHDPRPPHMPLRTLPDPITASSPLAVARTKPDLNAFPHPPKFADFRTYRGNVSARDHFSTLEWRKMSLRGRGFLPL